MNLPRTGLTKKPAASATTSTSTSTSTSTTGAKSKKTKTAQQAADSFASGHATLGQTLGMTPAQKDMLRQRAYAMLNEQRLDAAEPLLEGLVALDPFDPWVLSALGGLKLDRGAADVAAALLERAVQVSPLDVVARALRAEARAKTGNIVGAKQDIAALDKADANLPAIKRVRALAAAIEAAGADAGSTLTAVAASASKTTNPHLRTSPTDETSGLRRSRAKLT